MNLTEVTDLTSIGTLFAFVLVCGGILRLNPRGENPRGKFRTPYINGKWIFPALLIVTVGAILHFVPDTFHQSVSEAFPFYVFCILMLVLGVLTFVYSLSLIPVLGVASSGYLMTELGVTNWLRFGIWLVIGLACYFLYGVKHSKLVERA
jgi:hypothetical protein